MQSFNRGCSMPPNGWPQIQLEEMEIHLARQAFEGIVLGDPAPALTAATARSNTVNKQYPSTYTTGHSDGEGIEARQEALVVLGTENVQGGQAAQET